MTFAQFQLMNKRRCDTVFHRETEWPVQYWALAVAGEAGELCNLIKKALRGDFPIESVRKEILMEAVDVITYADLLISHMGACTEHELLEKFVEVNKRCGYEPKLLPELSANVFATAHDFWLRIRVRQLCIWLKGIFYRRIVTMDIFKEAAKQGFDVVNKGSIERLLTACKSAKPDTVFGYSGLEHIPEEAANVIDALHLELIELKAGK